MQQEEKKIKIVDEEEDYDEEVTKGKIQAKQEKKMLKIMMIIKTRKLNDGLNA